MSDSAKVAIPSQLLLGARRGDGPARDGLLIASGKYLSGIARQRLGRGLQSKVDASDMVQEAIVAAHRRLGEFRGTTEAEFAVWLRKILAARISNVRRHFGARRRDARREQSLSSQDRVARRAIARAMAVKTAGSPSELAARRERAEQIALALASLPPHYREVIVLRVFDDLAFAEVARRMDRTVDSVEKIWRRALAQLRDALGVNDRKRECR